MPRGHGVIQKKILLLLSGGLAIGLSHSPRTAFKLLEGISKEWQDIDRNSLRRAIKSLYESKMIEEKYNKDGTITIVLTDEGKKKTLVYDLDEMKIKKPKQWDKKWRLVMFDIPEDKKKERDGLRFRLKKMDFYEFQKSVFVHPFDCKKEIDFIVELYKIRKFVRFILAEKLDNGFHLRKHFGLL